MKLPLSKLSRPYVHKIMGVSIVLMLLCACSASVDENTVKFVQKAKAQKSQYVSKLPTFVPIAPLSYTAAEYRDPFMPFSQPKAEANRLLFQGGPDLNRPREALESFPLDSLQMVGTIEQEGVFFALLKNGAGMVYRAGLGNYLGQNSGKIEKINADEIQVKEWLPDAKGGWREHWATLPLVTAGVKAKGA